MCDGFRSNEGQQSEVVPTRQLTGALRIDLLCGLFTSDSFCKNNKESVKWGQLQLQVIGTVAVTKLGVVRLNPSQQMNPEYDSFHCKKKLLALGLLGLLHKVERGKVGLFYVKKHIDECEQILKNIRDLFRVSLKYPVKASIVPTRKRPLTTYT